MTAATKIQWAHHTASPWHGCQHAMLPDGSEHPGCLHCYAETMAKRNPKTLGIWGPNGTRVRAKAFHEKCVAWNKAAEKAGERRRVFPSVDDPFEDWSGEYGDKPIVDNRGFRLWRDEVSWETFALGEAKKMQPGNAQLRYLTMDHMRADLFRTIEACPNLDFLLLTKRPWNIRGPMRVMWPAYQNDGNGRRDFTPHVDGVMYGGLHMPNVHILYSASDQASLDAATDTLRDLDDLVPTIGISAEPLIGPLRLDALLDLPGCRNRLIDWVIVGGESGPGARPCNIEWIRDIVAECNAAGVFCFVKQLGSIPTTENDADAAHSKAGTKFALNTILLADKKGGDPDEWPEDLRVREFPMGVTE